MRHPLRLCLSFLLITGVLTACGTPKMLMINERQTLVLDAPLLSAGITAEDPSLDSQGGKARAASVVSNDAASPVTVHYRFYWYDDGGLEILPYDETQTLVLPPGAEVKIFSTRSNPDARQVRLHLFL